MTCLYVQNKLFFTLVDSSSELNVLDKKTVNILELEFVQVDSPKTYAINKSKLNLVGSLTIPCIYNSSQHFVEWRVTDQIINNAIFGRLSMNQLFGFWRKRMHWANRFIKTNNSSVHISENQVKVSKTRASTIPYSNAAECIPFSRLCLQLQKLTEEVESLNQRYNQENCSIESNPIMSNSINHMFTETVIAKELHGTY